MRSPPQEGASSYQIYLVTTKDLKGCPEVTLRMTRLGLNHLRCNRWLSMLPVLPANEPVWSFNTGNPDR
jgi:hypothetical protein